MSNDVVSDIQVMCIILFLNLLTCQMRLVHMVSTPCLPHGQMFCFFPNVESIRMVDQTRICHSTPCGLVCVYCMYSVRLTEINNLFFEAGLAKKVASKHA